MVLCGRIACFSDRQRLSCRDMRPIIPGFCPFSLFCRSGRRLPGRLHIPAKLLLRKHVPGHTYLKEGIQIGPFNWYAFHRLPQVTGGVMNQ